MNEIARVVRACQMIALPIAIMILLGNWYLQSYGPKIHRLIAYASLIVMFFFLGWTGYRVNRIRWRVKRENYLLCIKCLYPLKGLDSSGKCPECGTPYNLETLKSEWVTNLRKAPF